MLAIGSEKVTLGMPNVKGLYLGNGIITPVIPDENKPSGTVLHQYDRVDGKASVAGFWTDGNGQRYAVCVVDAQYRSGETPYVWSNIEDFTALPYQHYTSSLEALEATESGTYNTNYILNNYNASDYPAFNFARNALTIIIDNKQFTSCLPNLGELKMVWNNREELDFIDPTLEDYPESSLSGFYFAENGAWSSNEAYESYNEANEAYLIYFQGDNYTYHKSDTDVGVCPIIEIPVDENGAVL